MSTNVLSDRILVKKLIKINKIIKITNILKHITYAF